MRLLGVFLICVIHFGVFCCEATSYPLLSFSLFTSRHALMKHHHHSLHRPHKANPPSDSAWPPSESHRRHNVPFAPEPALSPNSHGSAPSPSSERHHHWKRPRVHSPSIVASDCSELFCSDPLTATTIGSPCGCVLPLKVELDLGVAPFLVFTVVPELEVEVAEGTYVKQSQVRIMSAVASGLEKTRVDINFVPLGEKFDNMTAFLIYERFRQKKVPINATIFGDYEVIFIQYPGLPSSPSFRHGAAPPGTHELPFIAYVPRGRTRKMNTRTIVIITLSSFIFVLMCIGIACILSKWRKHEKSSTFVGHGLTPPITKRSGLKSMMSSSMASSVSLSLVSTMPTCPPSVKTFTLAELDEATEMFSSKKILGEGGFGRVYHGIMEDGTEVAVKLLTKEDQNGDREFIAEVEMLSRLHHRNLVKLIGICIEGHTRCLVYELLSNGSVESHLHGVDRKRNFLDWDTRMKIAIGAARGLAYLHEDSNPRVIHRDFKASNVLLEEDFTPKVSDFGLAREASEGSDHISTQVMGTFGYVAPEYAMTGHLLVKSDVYSYGVVLLELLSSRKPVDMSQPQGEENLVIWARPLLTTKEGLEQLVDASLGENYDFNDMAKVAAIASMCVHPEVSQRPFMGEVVQALKLIYNDTTDEAYDDSTSHREESSPPDGEFQGEAETGSRWWNSGKPRLTFGYASSFVSMEYSSSPLDNMARPHSVSSIFGRDVSPMRVRVNRSGPLRTTRNKSVFARLRGSMSEHELVSRRFSFMT